ncbi:I78 family peptidase inhibitor [uncultured Sphingomonas sp.]|uniref:I78 family peptidase inhibitor n=1 Tax=uncultured Sphingomonas sp. TaxID=158754 RepID=UPI0025DFF312|nr:I78 family peptidase inhibitor [uncultured Sphingomonas sp.]
MNRLLVLVPAFLLSACVIFPVPVTVPAAQIAGGGECRNEGLERFVGQPASQQMGAEMQRASGARVLQWVGQDSAVTMDYRIERLRVRLDRLNRVESARCG